MEDNNFKEDGIVNEIKNELDETKIKKSNEVQDYTAEHNLDLNLIWQNPIKNLYEKFVNSFHKTYDKFILNSKEIYESKDLVNDLNEKISLERKEIYDAKKTNKISGRKFANGLIFFLFFILIGLCFIPIFKKNKRIINEFNNFSSEKKEVINNLISEKKSSLLKAFGTYNLVELKDAFLSIYGISKVRNIKHNEIAIIENLKGFASFVSINKYDIRNSYIYDILYSYIYIKDIVTSGSATITISSGDKTYTQVITAYHTEPTPFLDREICYLIPTNYLPSLNFIRMSHAIWSDKDIKKKQKNGESIPENIEFAKRFDYYYNDEIKYFQYFPLITQNNFVGFEAYFKQNNVPNFDINKSQNALHSSSLACHNIESYHENPYYIVRNILSDDEITFDKLTNDIKIEIWRSAQKIFQFLTMAYSNKNICLESFKEIGEQYLSDYLDDKQFSSDISLEYIHMLNSLCGSNFFKFKYARFNNTRPIYFKYVSHKKYLNVIEQIISMNSWYSEDLIDIVYKSGTSISVPFTRFYPTSENKIVYVFPKFHLNSKSGIIISRPCETTSLTLNSNFQDPIIDEAIKVNNIEISADVYKYCATNVIQSSVQLIDYFYKKFPLLKDKSYFVINSTISAIYLDDNKSPYSLEEISNFLESLL